MGDEQEDTAGKKPAGRKTKPEGLDYLGPDDFAAACKRRFDDEEIPGFGWIRIQNLSDYEIAEWDFEDYVDGARSPEGLKVWKAGLIVRCLVNAAGERRFSNEDRFAVAKADYAKVNAAFEACRNWCGIPRRDVDAMAALRAIQKNLEATPA